MIPTVGIVAASGVSYAMALTYVLARSWFGWGHPDHPDSQTFNPTLGSLGASYWLFTLSFALSGAVPLGAMVSSRRWRPARIGYAGAYLPIAAIAILVLTAFDAGGFAAVPT